MNAYHHHHHVVPPARISLTLFRHFSLSFIASGRSSGLHPVSSHSCCMYVRAGRPAFARPYVGVHRNTSLMSSSLLLQQCPACLVRLTWIVFVITYTHTHTHTHSNTHTHTHTHIYIYICFSSLWVVDITMLKSSVCSNIYLQLRDNNSIHTISTKWNANTLIQDLN